jgi:hypothetical protein
LPQVEHRRKAAADGIDLGPKAIANGEQKLQEMGVGFAKMAKGNRVVMHGQRLTSLLDPRFPLSA